MTEAPDALTWLQGWYATQCDGEWEHSFGVTVDTLDNPGWSLRIDLRDTALDGREFPAREVHRSDHDWFAVRVTGNQFEAACGPLNLSEAIHEFRAWATSRRPAA